MTMSKEKLIACHEIIMIIQFQTLLQICSYQNNRRVKSLDDKKTFKNVFSRYCRYSF